MNAWWNRSSPQPASPGGRGRVLVADDDPVVTALLVAALRREGFEVRAVADGASATAEVRTDPPDVIVLDWMMPGSLGVDVCRELTTSPATAGVPVLMLTTVGDETQVAEAFAAGATDYLTKPFDVREVVTVVTRLAGQRR